MPNTTDKTLPNFTRAEVVEAQKDLAIVHDLLAGTRRMWDRAALYIRKWKDEDDKVFEIRSKIETVFEGLGRTLSAAVGMLFAKAAAFEWNQSESAMKEHWANIDAGGTAGPVFVKTFAEAALRDGLGAILIDHTAPPEGVTITAANEKALNLRPTWASYARDQVIAWRTSMINNQQTLTLVVLRESAEVNDGTFGVKNVQRYRVLRLIKGIAYWTLYEQIKDQASAIGDFKPVGSGVFRNRNGVEATFIPLTIAYTGRKHATMVASIPLMGVAWANLAHWQCSTDLRFYRSLCAFPQPVVIGDLAQEKGLNGQLVPGKLRVGPMVGVHLRGEGASFTWAELTGSSLEQLEKGVAEKLQQMSQQGMSFLVTDTRAAETAEAKRLDATAENSTLATAAQGINDAVNLALEIHAWYLGIEKAGAPVFTLNSDYESTAMDPQTMVAYVTAVEKAGLPVRLLLEAWQKGGRIPPDADIEELEREMLAAVQAKEEQERLERDADLERKRDAA